MIIQTMKHKIEHLINQTMQQNILNTVKHKSKTEHLNVKR